MSNNASGGHGSGRDVTDWSYIPAATTGWSNESGSATDASSSSESQLGYAVWQAAFVCIICSVIIVGTIVGNILVCTAVAIVRKLRTPSNLLIVSLAVSDLLVAILVMPFATMYEVMGTWILGQTFCDTWTSMDVMLCTASILNLCMISIDRYFVITRPFQYAMKRTPSRMALMIACVWMSSALISIPPLFGWRSKKTEDEKQCILSQSVGYQFYATIGAFYLPLTVMIVIYYRIYMVSSRLAQAEARSTPGAGHRSNAPSGSTTPSRKDSGIHGVLVDREENHNFPNGSANKKKSDDSAAEMLPKKHHHYNPTKRFRIFKKSRLNRISSSKERKATKTLGVIMGAFTACWLPFFIIALVKPFCNDPDTCIPHWLNSLFLWLGYANSFLNPIIYARFNRDFRTPFKEILLLRCSGINLRLRSESYAEQYGTGTLRDCIRPPTDTIVRYHSQGQTIVKLGNGKAACDLSGKESGGEADGKEATV